MVKFLTVCKFRYYLTIDKRVKYCLDMFDQLFTERKNYEKRLKFSVFIYFFDRFHDKWLFLALEPYVMFAIR